MIQAVFKQQLMNSESKQLESCQVIVHYENKLYHAHILSANTEAGSPNYIQVDTPAFRSQYELQAYLQGLMSADETA